MGEAKGATARACNVSGLFLFYRDEPQGSGPERRPKTDSGNKCVCRVCVVPPVGRFNTYEGQANGF